MTGARLALALGGGGLVLPSIGEIAVFRPPQLYDLGALPRDRTTVVSSFRPENERWARAGYRTEYFHQGNAALSLIVAPRSKRLAQALIAAAVQAGGMVVVDGQKTDGIDSLWKACRKRADVSGAVIKAHGRLFWFDGRGMMEAFEDWKMPSPEESGDGFFWLPGVFAAGALDRGSELLIEAMPDKLSGRVVDLGAGVGVLAKHALMRSGVSEMHLVEAEKLAIDCALRNVRDERALFHWVDARSFDPGGPVDVVLTNPPFHDSREADPTLGLEFIDVAARMLSPKGTLWLVANRHLPYETTLNARFAEVEEAGGDSAYKVFRAARPKRA